MTQPFPPIQERTWWRLGLRRLQRVLRPSANPAAMASRRPLGVGLVGVGNVARWLYLPRLQKANGPFRLKAVFDVDTAAARRVADAAGARACGNLAELVEHAEVEAVFVCTPTRFHAEAVRAALAGKRHVLCEKPLGLSYAEARSLWEAAQAAPTAHMVNFSYRFRADLRYIGELLRAGVLGRVYHLWGSISQGNWFDEAGQPSKARGDAAGWKFGPGGGVIFDLGPHVLDLCRGWLGEVQEVQAWTKSLGKETADCEAAGGFSLRFQNGARAQLITSRLATGSAEQAFLEVSGARGSLRLDQRALTIWTVDCPRWRRVFMPATAPDFLDTFHAAITGAASDAPTFWDGMKNNELLEAVLLSANTRAAVSLPLGETAAGS